MNLRELIGRTIVDVVAENEQEFEGDARQLDRLELRLDDGTALTGNGEHFYFETPTVLAQIRR